MIIDEDVKQWTAHYNISARLIQAVVNAEGGGDRIIKAIQCSVPLVTTRDEAIKILCRSATHALSDFALLDANKDAFVTYWAARWAPRGVLNDPNDLNKNWPVNVSKFLRA